MPTLREANSHLMILVMTCLFGQAFGSPAFSDDLTAGGKLVQDDSVEAFIQRHRSCPDAVESYVWVCGATIQMPGPHISELCTSAKTPFFAGSLSLPEEPNFLSQAFVAQYKLPLGPLEPCQSDRQWNNPDQCATLTFFPAGPQGFGVFEETPPKPLPDNLPSPPFQDVGHTLAPDAFSELDAEVVAFYYTRWIGPKPDSPPDQCQLQTRVPDTEIGVTMTLPCTEMGNWRTHLRSAISEIQKRTIQRDQQARCDQLPSGAVLLSELWQERQIEQLRAWLQE